jgi:hypothetical protein
MVVQMAEETIPRAGQYGSEAFPIFEGHGALTDPLAASPALRKAMASSSSLPPTDTLRSGMCLFCIIVFRALYARRPGNRRAIVPASRKIHFRALSVVPMVARARFVVVADQPLALSTKK